MRILGTASFTDTGGCGRFFEGTGEEMHAALSKLGTLPDETIIYNGHEYTAGNVGFAKSVEPDNPAIARLAKLVQDNEVTTGLTTIGDEKEWNVFMRLDKDAIKYAVYIHYSLHTNLAAIDGLLV
jgi:hydroxyacylglutathione hydrolase